MLNKSHKLHESINLFISMADQRYSPITTIHHNGHILKCIPWTTFIITKNNWERVKEVLEILADSNLWEKKCNSPRFAKYHDTINNGLTKLNKYYSQFNKKLAFILAPALHPYYKLTYIEHVWGGAKEQEAKQKAGN
ncbi:hypothetical protein BGW80DRAFT_1467274 [Lactifluus volemus]|nr:hypothetical protein BGW80DRAFT_1467274 [Lactifluus volemus]